jgi:hypothetical protein
MGLVKLLVAWALSMTIYVAVIQGWNAARGKAATGFGEGLLGLGILLAIPSFMFAVIVGWPAVAWLTNLRPAWLVPLAAGAVLSSLMWILTTLLLPDGWRGAGQALVAYAAVLGLVWGCLNLATARP